MPSNWRAFGAPVIPWPPLSGMSLSASVTLWLCVSHCGASRSVLGEPLRDLCDLCVESTRPADAPCSGRDSQTRPATSILAPMNIIPGDFTDPRIVALLRHHTETARAQSPPCSAHALDLEELMAPDISFWAAWKDGTLMAIGALKQLDARHGEV